MYIIVGLGNPETDYAVTRHNMGFDVINKIAHQYEIDVLRKGYKSLYGSGVINGKKVLLVKPQTFMNNSGEAVKEIMDFYKEDIENLIVIYDDIDVDPEKIRIRKSGSAGGHNGMKSIIYHLGREDFPRIRVGIGKPDFDFDLINHVIGPIPEEEIDSLNIGTDKAKDAVIEIVNKGIDSAMNLYN